MQLCYQVATPDVAGSKKVTAYQGPLEQCFRDLSQIGYDGVELMTVDPGKLHWDEIRGLARQNNLCISLVCTGELFGQRGLSLTSPDAQIRKDAADKIKKIVDFAGFLGANINIGRVRGAYQDGIPPALTEEWAITALQQISDYALPSGITIVLEEVTFLETNFINTLAQAQCFMERVDRQNFRLMMDIFHMRIEEKDLFASIRDYIAHTAHVHLSDSNRRYPGQCGMNFDGVIRTFYESGYTGPFCTEIFQYPDMQEAARRSYGFLAPIFNKYYGRPE